MRFTVIDVLGNWKAPGPVIPDLMNVTSYGFNQTDALTGRSTHELVLCIFWHRGAANPGRSRLLGGRTGWKAGSQAELPAPRFDVILKLVKAPGRSRRRWRWSARRLQGLQRRSFNGPVVRRDILFHD